MDTYRIEWKPSALRELKRLDRQVVPRLETAISQFIYLVLFSYTFFFEGFTGLAITILCIVTLFVVMQFTGKVDWEAVFQKKKSAV